jgi:hypothetical protein
VGAALVELQRDLLGLSSRCRSVVVQGATHESLLGSKEHAARVAEVIREEIESIRTSAPGLATRSIQAGPPELA